MAPTREKSSLKLAAEIDRAWELKINHDFDTCLPLLSKLKQELQIPLGSLSEAEVQLLLKSPNRESIVDLLLLSSSLARSNKAHHYSKEMLEKVERNSRQIDLMSHCYYSYEKAMLDFGRGEYYSAFESLVQWERQAPTIFQKLCAKTNIVLCKENLGIPYNDKLEEIETLLSGIKDKKTVSKVLSQLKALKQRLFFRKGEIRKAIEIGLEGAGSGVEQPTYYVEWLQSLPYHAGYRADTGGEFLGELAGACCTIDYCAYRFRTLAGIFHPDDLRIIKPSEHVDRLYSWVWKWLCAPNQFPFLKVAVLVENLDLDWSHRTTWEDYYLIRNALSWVGLFDSKSEAKIEEVLSLFQSKENPGYSLLQYEYLFIQLFVALRDGDIAKSDEYLFNLKSSPLWSSDELLFRSLIESALSSNKVAPTCLASLVESLRSLIDKVPSNFPARIILIDLTLHQITDRQGRNHISKSAVLALDLLKKRGTVSLEEFSRHVFDISRFDFLDHGGKVSNLLSRLKKIMPETFTFRVKAGFVIGEGDWCICDFKRRPHEAQMSGYFPNSKKLVSSSSAERLVAGVVPRPVWQGFQSRNELELKFKKPRSSMNRILSSWIEKGLVDREGKGRHTRYHSKVLEASL